MHTCAHMRCKHECTCFIVSAHVYASCVHVHVQCAWIFMNLSFKFQQAQLRLCKLGPGNALILYKSLAPTPCTCKDLP